MRETEKPARAASMSKRAVSVFPGDFVLKDALGAGRIGCVARKLIVPVCGRVAGRRRRWRHQRSLWFLPRRSATWRTSWSRSRAATRTAILRCDHDQALYRRNVATSRPSADIGFFVASTMASR